MQFRDVFEVDGERVRDRSERLVKLFMNPSAAAKNRAAEIMRESARYNIGSVERNVNVPVPRAVVHAPALPAPLQVHHGRRGRRRAEGDAESVELHDRGRRARAAFPRGGIAAAIDPRDRRDVARSHGRVWVEPETGRVLMTEITIETPTVESTMQRQLPVRTAAGVPGARGNARGVRDSESGTTVSPATATYGNFTAVHRQDGRGHRAPERSA